MQLVSSRRSASSASTAKPSPADLLYSPLLVLDNLGHVVDLSTLIDFTDSYNPPYALPVARKR